jgi:hypothetical protein
MSEKKAGSLETALRKGQVRDPELAKIKTDFAETLLRNGIISTSILECVGTILEPDTIARNIGAYIAESGKRFFERIKEYDRTASELQQIPLISDYTASLYRITIRYLNAVNINDTLNGFCMRRSGAIGIASAIHDMPKEDLVKDDLQKNMPRLCDSFAEYKKDTKSEDHPLYFTILFMELFNSARKGIPAPFASEKYAEAHRIYNIAREGFKNIV